MSLPSGLASSRWASAPVSSGIASSRRATQSPSSAAVVPVPVSHPCPGDNQIPAARCPSSPRDPRPSILEETKPTYRVENPLKTGALGYRASRRAPTHTATTTSASTSSTNKNKAGSQRVRPPAGEQSHSFFDTPLSSAPAVRNSMPGGQPPVPQMVNPLSIGQAESTQMRNPLMGSGLASSVWAQRT